MTDYSAMTMSELFSAWVNNWKVLQTGLNEIVGDSPMPDPREIAKQLVEMPEDIWTGMFESDTASADLRSTMDLQELLANINLENAQILKVALAKNGRL